MPPEIKFSYDGISYVASVCNGNTTFSGRSNTENGALEGLIEMVERQTLRGNADASTLKALIAEVPGLAEAWNEVLQAIAPVAP